MKKASSAQPRRKTVEPEPYDKRKIDLTKFKPDISPKEWQEMFSPLIRVPINAIFGVPIETLSPSKTLGLGRTNLTIIMSTIVQVDAATPFARFDHRQTPIRKPVIQMHFQPGAYGITTAAATYIMVFTVDVDVASTFALDGSFGFISNAGTRTLSGKTTVSLIFKNVPPSQEIFGFLEQRTGGAWSWFSTRVSFPPLVLTL